MTEIPDELRRYVRETFDSVVKLEVLLLLRGDAERSFNSADVAGALQVSKEMMHAPLLELCGQGLLRPDEGRPGAYRYEPLNDGQRTMVDQVAEFYRTRRAAMVSLIYSQPMDRVQAFADAFKIRKET